MMERAGLHPQGFVAPAWLVTDDGPESGTRSRVPVHQLHLTVGDLASGRSHWVPSLVFGPGHLNEDLGVALQRRLVYFLARCSSVRVVLHPPCVDHQPRLARVLSLIQSQLRDREPVTYLHLLESLRRESVFSPSDRHAC